LATALGALFGGTISQTLQKNLMTPVESYRVVVLSYAALGIVLALLFARLSSLAEVSLAAEERLLRRAWRRLSESRDRGMSC